MKQEKILAIDDAQESLDLFAAILTRHVPDCALLTALGGAEGLELAQRELPSVILLDVKMPGMDGYEITRRLRGDPATATIPILMISGVVVDTRGRITGLECGADSYLCKPFEPLELVAQVRALLRIRRNEADLRRQRRQLEDELAVRSQALIDSERKFRLLFENAPDAIFIVDEHGRVLDANPAAGRLHELSREALVGKHVTDLVPPEQRAEVQRVYPLWFHGSLERYEGVSLTASGQVRPVEIRASRTEYNGQSAVLLNVRDITERRQAEEERNRLIMAIEQSAEAISITDAAGAIQYVNHAFEQITGYARSAALGRNPRILKSDKQDADFYSGMWNTLLQGNVWTGHVINKRKDEHLYRAELTISPIRDPSGRIINYVAVSRDVTRETELEEQLRQSRKMESIGRLAGGIAHDFNNLLTSIMGFSHIVWESLPSDHPLRGDVREIVLAGERAAQLTGQLLAFSRKQVMQVQPLDLNVIIREIEPMLRRTLGEDIALVVELDDALGCIESDTGQMQQVIMNLAVNARDAMPRGGRIVLRTLRADVDEGFCQTRVGIRPGAYVRLALRDNGVGVPEELREHIFEPFFTTKEEGHGTGLGLSMVYGIVQQSHGYIEFESEPGAGTEFNIYLPRSEALSSHPKPAASRAPPPRHRNHPHDRGR